MATDPIEVHAKPMSPAGSGRARTVRLIGYNLLTAAVLLIPIELALRLFEFEFALGPPKVEFGWPDPVTMKADSLVDPEVLWVPREYPARVAAARGLHPSMVFMGDSCTRWGGFDKELASMAEARNPAQVFRFVNVGVSGWSSWSGLQQLQRDVLPIGPKAITIYYGWNDHWQNFGLEDKDAAPFLEKPSRFRLAQLADKARLAFTAALRGPTSPYRVSLNDFRANLRGMVRIARNNGIIPILLTAPTSHRQGREPAYLAERWLTDLEALVPLHRSYVQAVRDVAAEEGGPLVDLYGEFNRLDDKTRERLFWSDGIHLNTEGSRKVAELIDRHLVQANLYERIAG